MLHTEEQKITAHEEIINPAILENAIENAQEQVVELATQEGTLSADALKKIEENNGKVLPFNSLTPALTEELELALQELAVLHEELTTRVADARGQNEAIKVRVDQLVIAQKIQINNDHYTHFDQSIATYVNLLLDIAQEVEAEIVHFLPYTSPTPPAVIMVHKDDTDDVEAYVEQKIHWIKRHVKTIRKDLMVSFSRYTFGFDSQMKQLDMIEAYVKNG